jgi:hypothetical protein
MLVFSAIVGAVILIVLVQHFVPAPKHRGTGKPDSGNGSVVLGDGGSDYDGDSGSDGGGGGDGGGD